MSIRSHAGSILSEENLVLLRFSLPIVAFTVFWCWESWRPFFESGKDRLRHARRNLTLTLINTGILGLGFATLTTAVIQVTHGNQLGLLAALPLPDGIRSVLALVLLDGWMYLWHRANHRIPFLWRFHRMHHSDPAMDVTTSTRFHIGELFLSSVLRLGLIPILGLHMEDLLLYDTLALLIIQFHHANVTVGRWGSWLGWLVVIPELHKVHHSNVPVETDSNYSTVFTLWDRLAGTLRYRHEPKGIIFGLKEYTGSEWQSLWGMIKTPFVTPPRG